MIGTIITIPVIATVTMALVIVIPIEETTALNIAMNAQISIDIAAMTIAIRTIRTLTGHTVPGRATTVLSQIPTIRIGNSAAAALLSD